MKIRSVLEQASEHQKAFFEAFGPKRNFFRNKFDFYSFAALFVFNWTAVLYVWASL